MTDSTLEESQGDRLTPDRSLSAYDYVLPETHIAQNPVTPRDSSRLLAIDSLTSHQHRIFRELPELLRPGDLLVMNNTRVIPARLYGRKPDGAKIEILLLEEKPENCWLALVKPGKRMKPGAQIEFGGAEAGDSPILTATVMAIDPPTGGRLIQFDLPPSQPLLPLLSKLGVMPLPPYITDSQADPEQYQTVYADRPGAVAAPTAGLHFTPELLDRLREVSIQQSFVTLHVGVGTFRPVEVEDITQHSMHSEWLEVPPETAEKVRQTQASGGRVIAVGTTAVRALEGASQDGSKDGTIQPYCGRTEIFIYPGYRWRVVDGLITNFHLPKSSLLMLVSALIGRERLLDLYQEAIAQQYRFYSFGDAMLILPEAKLQAPEAKLSQP
ncbi:MAG: tRNA preQ1(34) S-adenosylmethionine ribosyltransferase-isomerase QueA [Drouetiella hepatica Uher 2000/2452]|uniref:S-adenosylmethionine:tRNA ribosyltransferase-isomerase n=1 Tax=Drouetiella hepatica Uher 2000/2452 TaxID=904376 RepID=A0A951ULF6_9CYAN|nr:tRNA preQ1(34) S-adenosylmethionine ribosyltransferase-isomerase QueA [Drouetiella hepatica Uher 2000/2452]